MATPTRYDPIYQGYMEEHPEGLYVRWEDYERLQDLASRLTITLVGFDTVIDLGADMEGFGPEVQRMNEVLKAWKEFNQ